MTPACGIAPPCSALPGTSLGETYTPCQLEKEDDAPVDQDGVAAILKRFSFPAERIRARTPLHQVCGRIIQGNERGDAIHRNTSAGVAGAGCEYRNCLGISVSDSEWSFSSFTYTACEMMSRKCPKCGRVGQVRVERIYKATERRTNFSCAACGSSWTSPPRAERKPPKRKHAWLV